MVRFFHVLWVSREEHSWQFVQPWHGDGCSSHGLLAMSVCESASAALYSVGRQGTCCSGSVFIKWCYHRRWSSSFLGVLWRVSWRKKQVHSDVLWLKPNQMRAGHLIRKAQRKLHTHTEEGRCLEQKRQSLVWGSACFFLKTVMFWAMSHLLYLMCHVGIQL